ncbi:WxL domain-containing protein [Lysinibacillus sp. NPDC097214]|uniref:WxL domain-containing protein n=1 Tax=Lysinibacillus sp. NPDC097214 TaxID=3390584 RepID=UPI003D093297
MKINTNLKALGVAATMLTGFVVGGSATAFAEGGGGTEEGYNRSYNSSTVIEFQPFDGENSITPPVDPTDPGNEINPEPELPGGGDPGSGTNGPLSIDYASSLSFGSPKITSTTQKYDVKPQTFKNRTPKEGPNYVQVTDNRGNGAGWTLQVQQNGQFKTAKGEELGDGEELKGARIIFNDVWVNSNAQSNPATSPTSFDLKFNEDGTSVTETVMSAKVGAGAGTYVLVFGDNSTAAKSIQLEVPGTSTKYAKKYSTSLTWKLTDIPGKDA